MGIIIGFIAIILNFLLLLFRYIYAAVNVQEIILTLNPFYIILGMILPVLWWLYSTKEDYWHFYNHKKMTLRLVIANGSLCIAQVIWTFVFDLLVVRICQIPTGRNLDAKMLFILCRIALCGFTYGFFFFVYFTCRRLYENEELKESIETVRWQHLVDTRDNKKVAYDLGNIIRKMEDGSKMIIYEVDRFVHMIILGSSGTGKTSSTMEPAIISDLDKKLENKMKRMPLLMNYLKDGKGTIYDDHKKEIDEYSIVPTSNENKKELEDIRDKFPDCGITAMAPDNSLMVDIIKLAEARNITVNVIDPSMNYENKNVRMKGINPFFVPLNLDSEKRQIEITNRAQNFTEVLLAISEMHGVGDQYFRDINSSVTQNVSILCMLYANLNGTQTNITQIQSCISDFGKLRPIVDDIQKKLRMKVIVNELASSKKSSVRADSKSVNNGAIDIPDIGGVDNVRFDYVTNEAEIPVEYRNQGMSIEEYNRHIEEEGQSYAEHIHFVLQELLGAGSEYMFQQARGLRNILANLLIDARVRRILSAPEGSCVDFDQTLAKGEVTVINTALEFGPTASTALGLFIMLSLKIAVLRRPAKNRTNHFLYIDEASQYMHPMYEDMFALFRKYKVGVVLAIQSLSQMDKTDTTKYLKGVIMGAGIHIVFGRTDPDTMKYYEEIAGITHKETVQKSITSNSEFDVNYSVTSGKRRTMEDKQAVEAHEIRIRDFQEVTVYMVEKGRVLKGIHAKTSFPKAKDFKKKETGKFDLKKYVIEAPNAAKRKEISDGNSMAKAIASEKYLTAQKIVNIKNEEDSINTLAGLGINYGSQDEEISPEVLKERIGNTDMLHDQLRSSRYRVKNIDENTSENPIIEFEPLSPTLYAAPAQRKIKPAETHKKNEPPKEEKLEIDEDTNLDMFLNDSFDAFEPSLEEDRNDVENYNEDEMDEEEIMAAELEKLNNQRKAF